MTEPRDHLWHANRNLDAAFVTKGRYRDASARDSRHWRTATLFCVGLCLGRCAEMVVLVQKKKVSARLLVRTCGADLWRRVLVVENILAFSLLRLKARHLTLRTQPATSPRLHIFRFCRKQANTVRNTYFPFVLILNTMLHFKALYVGQYLSRSQCTDYDTNLSQLGPGFSVAFPSRLSFKPFHGIGPSYLAATLQLVLVVFQFETR